MLGLLVAVDMGAFGLACAEPAAQLVINVTCTQEGVVGLVRKLVLGYFS